MHYIDCSVEQARRQLEHLVMIIDETEEDRAVIKARSGAEAVLISVEELTYLEACRDRLDGQGR